MSTVIFSLLFTLFSSSLSALAPAGKPAYRRVKLSLYLNRGGFDGASRRRVCGLYLVSYPLFLRPRPLSHVGRIQKHGGKLRHAHRHTLILYTDIYTHTHTRRSFPRRKNITWHSSRSFSLYRSLSTCVCIYTRWV